MTEGFNGQMLLRRYRVRTEKKGRATIFFNDGSEVRLFGETELTIGAKKSRNYRWVRYRLFLHTGSFWGHFVRGKNPVEIGGGGMRLQLSDASLRFSRGKTGIDITVPSGMAKVSNKSSSVKLLAGQRLYQVRKNDFLPQKISLIPNQLKLWIEPSAPVFKGKESLKLNLHFQIVRYGTDRPVDRPGSVYLKSNYYNLKIPDSIRLNKDGKAKTTIEVAPPRSNDRTFEGTVTLHSIMDQSGYNDVQDGLLKVRFTSH
ncbi:MAG: FecR domain-containing protein [SAR324 cluster bacterium]|nr:FecR domain-containing protein [SAR324 cluster bacterium]